MSSRLIIVSLAVLLAACVAAQQNQRPEDAGLKHSMPSPDWRDQVIYFAMVDRFDDGDASNNDQGVGEYDPSRGGHYSGGDLRGLTRRIEYIQALGPTALWITPPVANQWWNPGRQHTGYHGYWARDFMAVDAHYGTLADYREFSDSLHRRGMYLIQDIVVNHSGDYFGYDGPWNPADPTQNFRRNPDVDGNSAPTQPPFDLNNALDPAQRAAAIYHYTPNVRDFADPEQEANYQMSGLDDLNTENPRVREALRQSYGWWIRAVGVDGFRVDTAFYVPPVFFEDFLYSTDPQFPGIDSVARATGRKQFHIFGEGFGIDAPGSDAAMRKIDRYMRSPDGRPRMPGMINFPLYGSLVDVYARGRPTADLAERIEAMMRIHAQPHLMPSFIDNHDVDRFLAGGSEAALRQALLAMLTLPGIPTIYYGTEQGFREPRAAMFAAGYGSGGKDHFDTDSALFRYLKSAIALRRGHPVLSRGTPEILHRNPAGAGALAWRMSYQEQQAIIVFNSSDSRTLLDHLPTGLAPGTRLQPLFAIDGSAPSLQVDDAGQISLELPPRSGYVWQPGVVEPISEPPAAAPAIEPIPTGTFGDDFSISGRASTPVQVVVDGQLQQAQTIQPNADGRWTARIDTGDMLDPNIEHHLLAWAAESGQASAAINFRVRREWLLLADIADPEGDDHGTSGTYQYPDDPGWRVERPADIQRVRVFGSGGSLQVELTMHQILSPWNPPNGFDHVAFTLFVELPEPEDHDCRAGDSEVASNASSGRAELARLDPARSVKGSGASSALRKQTGEGASSARPEHGDESGLHLTHCGARVMPLQNSQLPQEMRWHYRIRAHGWSNALFSAAGASADNEGSAVTPTARVSTDPRARTVTFTLTRAALGHPDSLAGARIYVNTWDYDGGYRSLAPIAGPNNFGGAAEDAAKIMDSSGPILLRASGVD